MRTSAHVTNTWLLANLLHPAIFLALIHVLDPDPLISGATAFFIVLILGFICSLPAYLLCLLIAPIVASMHASALLRFLLWIVAVMACLAFGDLLIFAILFAGKSDFLELMVLSGPAAIASLLAILIRYRSFFNLISPAEEVEDFSEYLHEQNNN